MFSAPSIPAPVAPPTPAPALPLGSQQVPGQKPQAKPTQATFLGANLFPGAGQTAMGTLLGTTQTRATGTTLGG